ncbi:uncharacterized protein LOC123538951 [Mercenaria mercenaria]|uniref:uncharacterized protein LOC123538951 n=1 Tax=Mercenaria mercenaria TaxID=6596 RepID=UPI001E1DFEB0|nr:uncharacterized protein LOC123538951 [Mercenaria mercenaria]
MATSTQNCDRIYIFRLFTLVLDGGSYVYRKVLEYRACEKNKDLKTHLNNSKKEIQKSTRVNKQQLEKLFPNNGPAIATTADEFDITLLAFLVQNTCKYPGENWIKPEDDNSEVSNLVRVREFRNDILHSAKTERFDEEEFLKLWNDIEKVLLRLRPNDQNLVDKIKAWQTEPFDKDLESEYQKLKLQLEKWEEWEDVQERVKKLETKVEKVEDLLMIRDIDDQAFDIKIGALRDIARDVIATHWEILATDLNVPQVKVTQIRATAMEEEEKIFRMLCIWQCNADGNTSFEALFKALKENASTVIFDEHKLKDIEKKYQLV